MKVLYTITAECGCEENWSTFAEVMGKNIVSFLTHGVEFTVHRCPTSDGAYFLLD